MANHKNFYETIEEARMRLTHTVVLYDGRPHYIYAVDGSRSDGIFRVYMQEIKEGFKRIFFPDYAEDGMTFGQTCDKYMKNEPSIVRKMANSPKFDSFRPFPLGMVNEPKTGNVYYLRRTPTRHTQQGLTQSMLTSFVLDVNGQSSGGRKTSSTGYSITDPSIVDCINGTYPSAEDVINRLKDPDITNAGAAFHREFAILRGPVGTMFLSFKENVIGYLPQSDQSEVIIDKKYKYAKELLEDAKAFATVTIK